MLSIDAFMYSKEKKNEEHEEEELADDETLLFKASAPGKCILFGEHAVVYGKTACAISLDNCRMQTTLQVIHHEKQRKVDVTRVLGCQLSIECMDLKEQVNGIGPLKSLKRLYDMNQLVGMTEIIEANESKDATRLPANDACHLALLPRIHTFLTQEENEKHEACKVLSPLLYLILRITHATRRRKGWIRRIQLTVQSKSIPWGAGLGSSAAFCVATSATLLQWTGAIIARTPSHVPSEKELELINAWAFAGECILHGNPSGLDNTVSTFGGLVAFTKSGATSEGFSMQFIQPIPNLRILLTNTNVTRETQALVRQVRQLYERQTEVVELIFNAMERISAKAIESLDATQVLLREERYETLKQLVEMNQGLLDAIGVNRPALSDICHIIKRKANWATKLTGAGGGGCAYTLLPFLLPNIDDEDCLLDGLVEEMEHELSSHGFTCIKTCIGGPGVQLGL